MASSIIHCSVFHEQGYISVGNRAKTGSTKKVKSQIVAVHAAKVSDMVKHSDTLLPHYIPTPTLCALTGGRLALQFLWKHEHKVAAHVRPCYPLTPHKCSDRFTTRLLGLYYLNPFMLQLRPEESLQCKIFLIFMSEQDKLKSVSRCYTRLDIYLQIHILGNGFSIQTDVQQSN